MILYSRAAEGRFWLVEADLTEAGDLLVTSGDNDHEWHALVRRPNLPLLVAALPGSYPPWLPDDVLPLLARAFPRDDTAAKGPFEAIKRLMDENGVPWESQVW